MVHILFSEFNNVQNFKLRDNLYTVKSLIFNMNYEIDEIVNIHSRCILTEKRKLLPLKSSKNLI